MRERERESGRVGGEYYSTRSRALSVATTRALGKGRSITALCARCVLASGDGGEGYGWADGRTDGAGAAFDARRRRASTTSSDARRQTPDDGAFRGGFETSFFNKIRLAPKTPPRPHHQGSSPHAS